MPPGAVTEVTIHGVQPSAGSRKYVSRALSDAFVMFWAPWLAAVLAGVACARTWLLMRR
jgi:hypothetical protein